MTRPCPCCNEPMRQADGIRGVFPNTWRETGWRCTSGYRCDLVGYLLFEETLADQDKIECLIQVTRNSPLVRRIRQGSFS